MQKLQESGARNADKRRVYPFDSMKIGESFYAHPRARTAAFAWRNYYPHWDFKCETVDRGVVRITRIA